METVIKWNDIRTTYLQLSYEDICLVIYNGSIYTSILSYMEANNPLDWEWRGLEYDDMLNVDAEIIWWAEIPKDLPK